MTINKSRCQGPCNLAQKGLMRVLLSLLLYKWPKDYALSGLELSIKVSSACEGAKLKSLAKDLLVQQESSGVGRQN